MTTHLRRFVTRLWNALRPGRAEAELSRELASHLTLLEDEYRRRGLSAAEAQRAARLALGGVEQAKDLHRDARAFRWIDDLRRDVRQAWRTLARAPRFASVAVLTMALGIGANTAVFSVVHALLLQPLPFPDADRLVRMVRPSQITETERVELEAHASSLTHVSYTRGRPFMTLIGRGEAVRLQGVLLSSTALATVGVPPHAGRLFTAGDASAIVLSHAAWQRHFGGDPAILGQTIALSPSHAPNGQFDIIGYDVIGVMPPDFTFPDTNPDFWIPTHPGTSEGGTLLARLSDSATLDEAAAELDQRLRALRGDIAGEPVRLMRVQDVMTAPVRSALWLLMGGVGCVLLIACVNLANLLIGHTWGRRREIAIRLALGAGRARVLRQLLTESTVIAVLGGLVGALAAVGLTHIFRTMATTMSRIDLGPQLSFPRLAEITVDAPVLLITLGVSMLAGVGAGLVPAITITRTAGARVLGHRESLRRALVVAEISLAMVLLVGGGLLAHSFARLVTVQPGYDPDGVLTFQISRPDLPPGTQLRMFADDVATRVGGLPGVRAVAYARQLPLVSIKESVSFRQTPSAPGARAREDETSTDARLVSRAYFDALGIRVIAGRTFDDRDTAGAPRSVVLNQALARREFPSSDAVGRSVFLGNDRAPWQVIGVVADVRQFGLDLSAEPQFFADFRQWRDTDPLLFTPLGPYFLVTADGNSAGLATAIRDVVRQLDPGAGVYNVATMVELLANSVARPRLYATWTAAFAVVAVLLAAVGLSGVMASSVSERTKEIGVRIALGADPHRLVRFVLRQSLLMTVVGVMLGLVGAMLAVRALDGLLFDLAPLDAATFVAVTCGFLVVAGVASWIPARRAARIDPIVALRQE